MSIAVSKRKVRPRKDPLLKPSSETDAFVEQLKSPTPMVDADTLDFEEEEEFEQENEFEQEEEFIKEDVRHNIPTPPAEPLAIELSAISPLLVMFIDKLVCVSGTGAYKRFKINDEEKALIKNYLFKTKKNLKAEITDEEAEAYKNFTANIDLLKEELPLTEEERKALEYALNKLTITSRPLTPVELLTLTTVSIIVSRAITIMFI